MKSKNGKEISSVVYWFYNEILNTKPDATHYASGYRILEPLMTVSEDEDRRTYTSDEIKHVVKILIDRGVVMRSLVILRNFDVIRCILDNDKMAQDVIISDLLKRQHKDGIYSDIYIESIRPDGW